MNETVLESPFSKSRFLFYFLVLLVIFLRVIHEIYFPSVESDNGVLIEAAKNFLDAKGFSNCGVSIDDLSNVTCSPLTMWPVGYSILLVLVYFIFNNWFFACIFWQSLGALMLIFFMYRILKLYDVEKKILIFFLIFMAFTPSPFYYLGPTDILSVDIFLWCTYITLKCSMNNIFKWKHFFLIGVLSAVNCFLRFASIPNLVIFPLFFLLTGILRKDKRLILGMFFTIVVSVILVILFFSVFKINSGRTSFIQNILHLDFYFNHLKWFDPFPIKSFFYARPLEYRLPVDKPELIRWGRIGLHIASVFFLFLLTYKFIFKEKIYKHFRSMMPVKRITANYFLLLIIVSFVIIGFMSLQSLTVPPENNSFGPAWMPHFWTHVYSTRYFVLLMAMLQIAFFIMLSKISFLSEKVFGILSYGFFITSFLYSIGFWIFTNYQIHSKNGNGGASFWRNYSEHVIFYDEINAVSNREGKNVIFASCNLGKNAPAMTYSKGYPCRDYEGLLNGELKHSSPLCLMIEIPQKENEKEKRFLEKYSPKAIYIFSKTVLYRLDIQ